VILRCTRKLRLLLGSLPLDSLKSVPAHGNDWYANLLWIDRRKCLLVTHAGTLFSDFVADVHAADIRPIGRFIVPLIEHELQVEGLSTDTFGRLTPDDVIITKTADRSVLGCMNDMSFVCESAVSAYGGIHRSDVGVLNPDLRRHINSSRNYVPPIDLAVGGPELSTP
jgi:hypothetical protein